MIRFLLALLLGLSASAAAAAQPAKPLFASDSVLGLTIQAPLERLIRDRSLRDEIPGTLGDGAGNRLPVTLELRGITRRTAEVCDFPPLRVRFTTPPPANSPFAGQRQLKLVTHCRKIGSADEDVLLEYAAYKMYQALTSASFGARLARIDYVGANGRSLATRPGFFIEELEDVAERNATSMHGGRTRIPTIDLNRSDAARYALFQHMLANHDWSMRAGPTGEYCCHNARLIGKPGANGATPIPYDFDFSGFVNAPYASPPDQLQLSSVRERRYRGYCLHNAETAEAARALRSKQAAVEAELAAVPGLDPRALSSARAFLATFFAEIATDSSVEAKILKRCIG